MGKQQRTKPPPTPPKRERKRKVDWDLLEVLDWAGDLDRAARRKTTEYKERVALAEKFKRRK
jgi:hypothetical protein